MSDPDVEIFRVEKGRQVLEAWEDYGIRMPGAEDYPAAIDAGLNDVVIAWAGEVAGFGTVRYGGPHPRDRRFGQVVASLFHDEEKNIPAIYGLEVKHQYRGKEIAKGIMWLLQDLITKKESVADRAVLSVRAGNKPARNLYDTLGYETLNLDGQNRFKITVPELGPEGRYIPKRVMSLFMTKDLSKE